MPQSFLWASWPAQGLYQRLQRKWNVTYDQSGAIGRRYRRADEAGVPFALTVDFDTLEGDGSITLRDRDTTEQQRMSMDEAVAYLEERINPWFIQVLWGREANWASSPQAQVEENFFRSKSFFLA